MTDKEKLIALLTEFGVEIEIRSDHIICRDGAAKVEGYCMFFTDFEFDANGKFVKMGAWE